MEKSSKDFWLGKTHQLWKMRLALFFSFLLFLHLVLQIVGCFIAEWAILPFGAFTFFWLAFSVKCPNCNRRPIYRILRTSELKRLGESILFLNKCPFCGYSGDNKMENNKGTH